MATHYIIIVTFPLLILLATHGNCGDNRRSVSRGDPVVTAMKGMSHVLECYGVSMKDEFHKLSDEILDVKDQLRWLNGTLESKREDGDSDKVGTLTQENEELKEKLKRKENTVDQLTESNIDLKNKLADNNEQVQNLQSQLELKTKENELNSLKVQNLTAKLDLKTKENKQNALKCIESPVDWTKSCEHPKFAKIKEVITTFSNSRDWAAMRRDITPLLDPSSDVLKQLSVVSMWNLGYNGYTQLAAMLLCAGLPVDTGNGDTMLIGASQGNNLETVKLLIERGANVNEKGNNGWTPLIGAYNSQLEIVKLLVAAGADTTAKDKHGNNALYWAKAYGNTAVVEYLQGLPQ